MNANNNANHQANAIANAIDVHDFLGADDQVPGLEQPNNIVGQMILLGGAVVFPSSMQGVDAVVCGPSFIHSLIRDHRIGMEGIGMAIYALSHFNPMGVFKTTYSRTYGDSPWTQRYISNALAWADGPFPSFHFQRPPMERYGDLILGISEVLQCNMSVLFNECLRKYRNRNIIDIDEYSAISSRVKILLEKLGRFIYNQVGFNYSRDYRGSITNRDFVIYKAVLKHHRVVYI